MARARKIPVSALNIAMHAPHSVDGYVSLMRGLYSMKRVVNIRSLAGLLIGSMYPIANNDYTNGIAGEIYQFANLDSSEPWFDVNTLEEATDEEVSEIYIPENLKPHLARFTYVFYPRGHRLYVQTRNKSRSVSVVSIRKFLIALLNDASAPRTPKVEITIEPERDTISKILQIKNLRKLQITLVRPNPDDFAEAEKRLLNWLARQGADKMEVALHADNNDKLKLDEDTVVLARVAASNGVVVGHGRDAANSPVKKSTADQPWTEVAKFNENAQTEQIAVIYLAQSMHAKFSK